MHKPNIKALFLMYMILVQVQSDEHSMIYVFMKFAYFWIYICICLHMLYMFINKGCISLIILKILFYCCLDIEVLDTNLIQILCVCTCRLSVRETQFFSCMKNKLCWPGFWESPGLLSSWDYLQQFLPLSKVGNSFQLLWLQNITRLPIWSNPVYLVSHAWSFKCCMASIV